MTISETGEYIKQLFRIKLCKGGAAAPAGKESGIGAYSASENDNVQLDPDRRRTIEKDKAFAGRAFCLAGYRAVSDGVVLTASRHDQLAIQYLICKQTQLQGEAFSFVLYVGGLRLRQNCNAV